MRFLAIIPLFVSALARPQSRSALLSRDELSQVTIQQANNACGSNQQVSCCNKVEQGDTITESSGVLSGVLGGVLAGGLSLADQCSDISVTALIGINDLLSDHCSANVACCEKNTANAEGGLVNIALPCISLGSLLG
jgi:hypothetical protein